MSNSSVGNSPDLATAPTPEAAPPTLRPSTPQATEEGNGRGSSPSSTDSPVPESPSLASDLEVQGIMAAAKEPKLLATLPEEHAVTVPAPVSTTGAIDNTVAMAPLDASLSGSLTSCSRPPPAPPSLSPPPEAIPGVGAVDSLASSSGETAKVSTLQTPATTCTPLNVAAPEEAEAVAARLGESRAQEFKDAVLQAEGLDPELRDGLFALLTSSSFKSPAAGMTGRPPRPSTPTVPPPSAAGATRPKLSEERRARSANASDQPTVAAEVRPGSRASEQRRSRSAADAESSLPPRGSSATPTRPDSQEAEGRPPRSASKPEAPRRRISEERRAKSALGMNERCSPTLPADKVAAEDHNDVLSQFLQDHGQETTGSHWRPESAPQNLLVST